MNKFESKEDYLERILVLSTQLEVVRAIDIAKSFSYSKPSVSIALKKLKEEGKIEVDEHGGITLTETGKEIANETYEKHQTIYNFLLSIGVNKNQALIDACKIEHDLSNESFNAIKKIMEK